MEFGKWVVPVESSRGGERSHNDYARFKTFYMYIFFRYYLRR